MARRVPKIQQILPVHPSCMPSTSVISLHYSDMHDIRGGKSRNTGEDSLDSQTEPVPLATLNFAKNHTTE